jgi:hypothetical protein
MEFFNSAGILNFFRLPPFASSSPSGLDRFFGLWDESELLSLDFEREPYFFFLSSS